MPVRDIFKVKVKTFLNPSGWLDLESLIAYNRTLWDVLRGLFMPPKPVREETFEQAIKRFGLTEADVKERIKNYRLFALIFLIFGLVLFAYSFYLLFRHGTFLGWLLGIAVTTLFFSQAFRYDFWAFQLKRRQLGATFAEWKRSILGDKGPSA